MTELDDALFPLTEMGQSVRQAAAQRSPAFLGERELYSGRPAISVQVGSFEHLETVGQMCLDTGLGAVLTVDARSVPRNALPNYVSAFGGAAGTLRDTLVDANRYSGTRRRVGVAPLDVGWVDAQLDAGSEFALTDSPYIPAGDIPAVESTLTQTRKMKRRVIAALPIAIGWLSDAKASRRLRDAATSAGVPVALIVEHRNDPMGVKAAVRGLLEVLRAEVPVFLLRSDLSAVGAVAHGAAGGAIGTTTALRHIFPLPDPGKSGGPGREASVAAWVPSLLSYISVEKIADISLDPDAGQYLRCDCIRCAGLGVERITNEVEAFDHSLRAISDFAILRLGGGMSPEAQRQAWHQACQHAQHLYLDIEGTTGVPLTVPRFLGAWWAAHAPGA